MRLLILGGVAAGTKIAAKFMREDRSAEVVLLNKGMIYLMLAVAFPIT